MANRAVKRATPRSGNYGGVRVSTMKKRDIPIVLGKEDEFLKGCRMAGIAMILMFAVLSVGCVAGAW